jgi:hypothetical protein
MKQLLCIAIAVFFLSACKKESINEPSLSPGYGSLANSGNNAVLSNLGPVPADAFVWTRMTAPVGVSGNWNRVMVVNGSVYCQAGAYPNYFIYKLNNTSKLWEPFDGFEINAGSRYLFTHQSKMYFGLTVAGHSFYNNFYAIDATTGVKTTLADFPGTFVGGFTSFVVGGRGYLLGGITPNSVAINQYWEYSFAANQWINRGNSPLGARFNASVMVVDDKAYIGLGAEFIYLNGNKIKQYKNDWIQFTPSSTYYPVKANFPGQKRESAGGFVINSAAYVGFGSNDNTAFTDFWKYNPSSNTWIQQANWPGTFDNNYTAVGAFTLGNAGYVVKGGLDEFWRFSNSSIVGTN